MPVEMVDEDAETKPPPQESTPKMASPIPEAPKAGEGLGRRGDILAKVGSLMSLLFVVDFGKNLVFFVVLWITWMMTSFKIGDRKEVILSYLQS